MDKQHPAAKWKGPSAARDPAAVLRWTFDHHMFRSIGCHSAPLSELQVINNG
jgi:spore maturation protein CgeB